MTEDHLTSSLLIGLIGGIVDLDSTATWQFMISQPIVAAPLTGLFLGALAGQEALGLKLGLMIGTILQLLWVEQLPLGMNVPPDAALASVLSVALGFLAGSDFDTYVEREVCNTVALLVAVALGLFGRALDRGIRRLNTRLESWVSLRLQSGTSWALAAGHTLGGVLTFGKAFLFCFFVTWLGVEPLRAFTRSLSFGQNTGFIVIQGLLPAVGFAVLAGMCIQSQRELRWFLGGVILFTILPTSVWIGWIVAGIAAIRILWTQNDAA